MSLKTKLSSKKSKKSHHAVVRAYAGTGKTFSQIMGVAWAYARNRWDEIIRTLAERKGLDPETFVVVPSEEQQAIWNHMASIPEVKSIIYCAFNRSIVDEFNQEWGWLCDILKQEGVTLTFATVNSLGNKVLYNTYGRMSVNRNRVEGLIASRLNQDIWELRKNRPVLLQATSKLIDLCKLTLIGYDDEINEYDPTLITHKELSDLVAHYDIQLNGDADTVFDIIPDILAECMKVEQYKDIDYNDQNWLPVVLNLHMSKFDLALVDEGQDLPRCKQEFVIRLARHIMLVGDVFQAIYGFAGADVQSIPRMEKMLGIEKPLTLSETRRCAKAIVEEAKAIVPDFKAHESNKDGTVRKALYESDKVGPSELMQPYHDQVEDGDMCLCRTNGPLVSQALKFIRDGRKALIRGRAFGKSLSDFVKKIKANDAGDLISRVSDWCELEMRKENKKKFPSEAKLMNLEDRRDCIISFAEGVSTVQEVQSKIDLVFAGKQCPKCKKHFNEETDRCPTKSCKTEPDPSGGKWKVGPKLVSPVGIVFSSIHRAKGLEAKRVFLLQPKGATIPHPMAKTEWQRGQEMNLLYVAITRAIEELVYVS